MSFWKKIMKYVVGVGLIFTMAGTASADLLGDVFRIGKAKPKNKGQVIERTVENVLRDAERRREQARRRAEQQKLQRQRDHDRLVKDRQKAMEIQISASQKMEKVDEAMTRADDAWQRADRAAGVARANPNSPTAKQTAQQAAREAQTLEKQFAQSLKEAEKADRMAEDMLARTGGDPYAKERMDARAERAALLAERNKVREEAQQRQIEAEQKAIEEKIRQEQEKASKAGKTSAVPQQPAVPVVAEDPAAPPASGSSSLRKTFKGVAGALFRRKLGLPATTNVHIHLTPGQK